MPQKQSEILLTLVKLRYYLVSLIENPEECYDNFNLSEEFLERRNILNGQELISKLEDNGISNDCDIAFNKDIHNIFRNVAQDFSSMPDLKSILEDFEIKLNDTFLKEDNISKFRRKREESLNEIIGILFRLAKNWSMHHEIEDSIDDFNALDDVELLRPDEEKQLDVLGDNSVYSFDVISKQTEKYIQLLSDYYFKYGGDLILAGFVNDISNLKTEVAKKYSDLSKSNGLDTES
ncbi:MAG: hypothetical protein COW08_03230 [Ignavibacteriales bacterium CG12_big_fil_rev_8_21_14_0_65_30_8]|nr:MAG: hypothetical protein COW08_03230 [Ignavibacteriales bacterium CG12_big_fil_rev_8_21_14_0_65_30_8]